MLDENVAGQTRSLRLVPCRCFRADLSRIHGSRSCRCGTVRPAKKKRASPSSFLLWTARFCGWGRSWGAFRPGQVNAIGRGWFQRSASKRLRSVFCVGVCGLCPSEPRRHRWRRETARLVWDERWSVPEIVNSGWRLLVPLAFGSALSRPPASLRHWPFGLAEVQAVVSGSSGSDDHSGPSG
jgi:hypothetical protein